MKLKVIFRLYGTNQELTKEEALEMVIEDVFLQEESVILYVTPTEHVENP